MAKVRVPLHGKPQGYANVETEATKGATLGENLYRQDGSVVTEADLAPAATASGGVAVTIWRLIREIPANIKGLAAVTTDGWFRKDGATIVAREIAGADLPDLADSGTGTFKLLDRDEKGRAAGTKDGTTSDVPEGSNLYHTAQRVRDTILTGLSTATNAVITATDTVLAALGKLQAQISGHLADTSDPHDTVVQTITDGDTTHAPSVDAVFDALALKADDAALAIAAAPSTTQTLANATNTKVTLDTESLDTDGCFDTTTSRFTPTKAGLYLVTATVSLAATDSPSAGQRVIVYVYKNGAELQSVTAATHGSPTNIIQVTSLVSMNGSTDYIEMYVRRDTTNAYHVATAATKLVAVRLGT